MRYSKYLSYRDSEVVWMKEVPSDWTSIKFKQVLTHKTKTTNHSLNCGSISFGNVVYKDNEKIPEETRAAYQEVLAGEFLINPLNLNFDLKSLRTALSTLNVAVSTGYIVLQGKPNINKNYLRWLLYQFDVAHMKTLGAGVRQTVNYTDIGNEYFFMPPLQEQQTIANYLDIATVKIDTLIEKKTKLIELLKEKRQAVISTAVTRGLDNTVVMKDSGVEWLGEIPEHWVVSKLRFKLNGIKDGTHGSHKNVEKGKLLLSGKNIKNGSLLITENERIISQEEYQGIVSNGFPKKGDVLFVSIGATLGKVCVYNEEKSIAFQRSVCFLRPNKSMLSSFLYYILRAPSSQSQINSLINQATISGVYMGDLVETLVPVVPFYEQQKIVNYLDDKTSKLDNLITKSTKAIDLLKEKRTALISSAVTGKIDVREVA